MDIGVISVRYARALLKSATDAKIEDAVYTEMQQLAKSYVEVPQLRFTIDNPMLSKEKKEALLLTAVGKKPSELTKAFIQLVLKEDRESVMQPIRTSRFTANRRMSSADASSPLPLYLLPQSRRCARWWRVRLMELWSSRLR